MRQQILHFGLVGVAGFFADAGSLYVFLWLGSGPYLGKLASYFVAATCTWLLNRHFTFRSQATARPLREWMRFLAVNSFGGLVNWGVFSLLVTTVPAVARAPILGVAISSLAGMVVNFTLSRRLVFTADRRPAP